MTACSCSSYSHCLPLCGGPAVIALEQLPPRGHSIDAQHRVPIDDDIVLVAQVLRLDLIQQLLMECMMRRQLLLW